MKILEEEWYVAIKVFALCEIKLLNFIYNNHVSCRLLCKELFSWRNEHAMKKEAPEMPEQWKQRLVQQKVSQRAKQIGGCQNEHALKRDDATECLANNRGYRV